jgi:hypothetical protein
MLKVVAPNRKADANLLETNLVRILSRQIARTDSNVELGFILKLAYGLNCGGVLSDAAAEALQAAVDRRRAS